MVHLMHEKTQMLSIILNSSAPGGVQTRNEDDVQRKGARLNIFYTMFDVACNELVEFENKAKKNSGQFVYYVLTSSFIK